MIQRLKRYLKSYLKDRLNRKYWYRNAVQSGTKRALLSYITRPFRSQSTVNHTNDIEARLLAESLGEFGYSVDVVGSSYRGRINYEPYDLILGQGYPLENSFKPGINVRRVYYASGAGCCQRNRSEVQRVIEFRQASDSSQAASVYPTRQKAYPDYMSGAFSDAILCTGNQFTVDTYDTQAVPLVETVNLPIQKVVEPRWIDRDFERARTHFLWFGGSGAILKGMDLCVRAFQELGGATLHLCGPREDAVFNALSRELSSSNVRHHGFIEPGSEKFVDITSACSFVVFPSVSEAGAGSVLTAMTTGLIPVVTEGASVDINDFGVRIENPVVEAVRSAVRRCMKMPVQDVASRSKAACRRIRERHTVDRYKQTVRSVLRCVTR